MTTPNLTGATIEVILADRTRARISLTELFEHLVATAMSEPLDSLFTTGRSVENAAQVADIVNPHANALLVTSDFVEAVAKGNDGTNAAVAKVAETLDATPVAKKVAAKTAGKKAGSAS